MSEDSQIILLTDIIEQKLRKEKEMEFYQKQLQDLERKMFFVKKEIELTNVILEIIKTEKDVLVKEKLIDAKYSTVIEYKEED